MRSPPAPNSQLSTVGAVRGILQKGMLVHQRDLDQAFMRIHVKIEDEEGKKATLRLHPSMHGFGSSDRSRECERNERLRYCWSTRTCRGVLQGDAAGSRVDEVRGDKELEVEQGRIHEVARSLPQFTHGGARLEKETVKIDPYHVTKRGAFEAAGAFHAVSESLNESLALAHANTARKLAGKNDGWESPSDA
jgi:hypothetical protein